jgi:hypothetical protein
VTLVWTPGYDDGSTYTPGKLVLAKEFTWNETVWNPSMISTALWLDAADASTVTTVSGAVSQWNDKSGNGRNATQATAASRPTYTSAGLNGRNILTLDGNDILVGSAKIANPGFGMFVVCSFASNTSRMGVFDIGNASGFNHCTIEQNTFSSPTQSYGFYVTSTTSYSSAATSSGHKIISATSNAISGSNVAAGTTYTVNGTNSTLTSATGSNYGTIGAGYTIGAFQGNILNLTGTVAEAIAFSAFVDTLTRQKLEGYLAHKWGLTANLPNDHPYKTVGPTP